MITQGGRRVFETSGTQSSKLNETIVILEEVFPGFLKKVVALFLESQIKRMLPSGIVTHADFKTIFSGERNCFGTESEQLLKYTLVQCGVTPFDGLLSQCHTLAMSDGAMSHIRKAMIAYMGFWHHNYWYAFAAAKSALMDRLVVNFDYKLEHLFAFSSTDDDIAEMSHAFDHVNTIIDVLINEVESKMGFKIIRVV